MSSVTQFVKEIKQPHGGYFPVSSFQVTELGGEPILLENESVSPSTIGMAVDYLTRVQMGALPQDAFLVALMGANLIGQLNKAQELLSQIKGLDTNSIIAACKLAGYDCVYRAGPQTYKPVEEIIADSFTCDHIVELVNRSIAFLNQVGPIVKSGMTFEGGYTAEVDSGDGDYLTNDTIWDFKVSVNKPNSKQTLQIGIYYLLGKHSIHPEFQTVHKIGIFNPRLNTTFVYDMDGAKEETIKELEGVLGFGTKPMILQQVESLETTKPSNGAKVQTPERTLTAADLMKRYGVSREKLMKDFVTRGLPYEKKGRQYVFSEDEVKKWEIRQKSVPYRNKEIVLPAFIQYKNDLLNELAAARKAKDKEKVKTLQKQLKEAGIRDPIIWQYAAVFGLGLIVFLIVLFILK